MGTLAPHTHGSNGGPVRHHQPRHRQQVYRRGFTISSSHPATHHDAQHGLTAPAGDAQQRTATRNLGRGDITTEAQGTRTASTPTKPHTRDRERTPAQHRTSPPPAHRCPVHTQPHRTPVPRGTHTRAHPTQPPAPSGDPHTHRGGTTLNPAVNADPRTVSDTRPDALVAMAQAKRI